MREFADGEIAPGAAERDELSRFPSELIPTLAEQGLLGIMVPEEYGGSGYDAISSAIIIEESRASMLPWLCSSGRTILCAPATFCWRHPTAEAQLPAAACAMGELGAWALTSRIRLGCGRHAHARDARRRPWLIRATSSSSRRVRQPAPT